MSLEIALLMLPGLVIGLTVHEFAHAWSASLLGDDFARRQGRVSLSPFRHLAPLGTLAIFVLPFGWGKPVPVNLYNFKQPRRDYLITSLAGPAANVVIAGACVGLMHLTRHTLLAGESCRPWLQQAHFALMLITVLNLVLATLNLIPIPPLDGSKIWTCLLPRLKPAGQRGTTWLGLTVLLLLLWTNSLSPLLDGMIQTARHIMPQSDHEILLEDGLRALHAKQWVEAEEALDEAMTAFPRNDGLLFGRAVARAGQGRWADALADLDAAIALDPRPKYCNYRAEVRQALEGPFSRRACSP